MAQINFTHEEFLESGSNKYIPFTKVLSVRTGSADQNDQITGEVEFEMVVETDDETRRYRVEATVYYFYDGNGQWKSHALRDYRVKITDTVTWNSVQYDEFNRLFDLIKALYTPPILNEKFNALRKSMLADDIAEAEKRLATLRESAQR